MEIRTYQQSDNKNFMEFYEKLCKENEMLLASKEEMSKKLAKQEKEYENEHKYRQMFIAIEENDIVGFLAIKKMHFEKLRHTAKFVLGYLEDYKEDGVGSQLVDYAEEWAEENKIERLEIHVIDDDEDLEDLLDDLDFQKEGTRKSTIKIKDSYHNEVVMVKKVGKK